jgi:LacI family transcriptional regulator
MTVKKTYSQKEIAQILNVSRGTIDQVIHNRGRISEDTAKKVRDFLEKIDYKPNKVGRGLSKKFNKHIYIVYHVNENDYFREVKKGIQAAMAEIEDYGFHAHVLLVDRSSSKQIKLIEELLEKEEEAADAIILSPYEPDKFQAVIDKAWDQGVPVVTFNEDVPDSQRMFYVGMDHYRSGQLAAEVLGKVVKAGEIAILLDGTTDSRAEARMSGFMDGIGHFPGIVVKEHTVPIRSVNHVSDYTSKLIQGGVAGIFPLRTSVRGVVEALEEQAGGNVAFVAYDLNKLMIDSLKKDIITAVICQEPFYQGYLPVKVVFDYFFHHKFPVQQVYQTKLDVIFKWNVDNIGVGPYNKSV